MSDKKNRLRNWHRGAQKKSTIPMKRPGPNKTEDPLKRQPQKKARVPIGGRKNGVPG